MCEDTLGGAYLFLAGACFGGGIIGAWLTLYFSGKAIKLERELRAEIALVKAAANA